MTTKARTDAAQVQTADGTPLEPGPDGLVTLVDGVLERDLEQLAVDEQQVAQRIAGNVHDVSFPVDVNVNGLTALPLEYTGTVELDSPHDGRHMFNVVDGVAAATTRARLELLLGLGGTISPTGDAGNAGTES